MMVLDVLLMLLVYLDNVWMAIVEVYECTKTGRCSGKFRVLVVVLGGVHTGKERETYCYVRWTEIH